MAVISRSDFHGISMKETKPGTVVSIVLSLISMAALSVCFSRRVQNVRKWSKLPLVCWLILIIYSDSIIFTAGTAILSHGFGVDSSKEMCSRAVLLCLGCYMTTKLIYYWLVERAYIIRRTSSPRMKSKLYLFNSFGMLIPYCVVIVLNFYFRFAVYDGACRIGMKRLAMIPLIGFDILVNVYLTTLFLLPLRSLYSYQNNPLAQTRKVALRTFIGSCCTLASSVVNLTVVMVLNGEPGWICLMCCNIDILFSVLVLHWITAPDNASTINPLSPTNNPHIRPLPNGLPKKRMVPRPPLSQLSSHETGISDYITRNPRLTDLVTVAKDDKGVDLYHMQPPEKAITVRRDMVWVVDELRIGKGSPEKGQLGLDGGSDTSASVRESFHRTRSGSGDGLFLGKC